MRFSVVSVLGLALPAFVSAANHTVMVGANADGTPGLVFTPNTVTAAEGDVVNFQFMGGNHTVTQSSFAAPCTQQRNTETGALGIDSGFIPFDANSSTVSVWSIEIVNASRPIWMFCNRDPHCTGGMVFAVNPPTTGNTFDLFLAAAATAVHPGPGMAADFNPSTGQSSDAVPVVSSVESVTGSTSAGSSSTSGSGPTTGAAGSSPSGTSGTTTTGAAGAAGSNPATTPVAENALDGSASSTFASSQKVVIAGVVAVAMGLML